MFGALLMATLRQNLLPVINNGRKIIDGLGFRTSDVSVVTRLWPSGRRGDPDDSSYGDTVLPLVNPRPKVRQVSSREIAGSGGTYQDGDLRVDKLTPKFAAGGYTLDEIAPVADDEGVEILYVVTGPLAGEYRRINSNADRALGYSLTLRRMRTTT